MMAARSEIIEISFEAGAAEWRSRSYCPAADRLPDPALDPARLTLNWCQAAKRDGPHDRRPQGSVGLVRLGGGVLYC